MTEDSRDEADAGWHSGHADASGTDAHSAGGKDTKNTNYPSDEDLLRAFVGPNAEKFVAIYRAQKAKKKKKLSFNWVVLLAALPWYLYRKLYLFGACIVLVPIALVVVFPDFAEASLAGMAGALAVMSNSLYVQTAERRIAKLKSLNLPPAELVERVRKAGGTSPAGAVFGTLVVASMIALPFLVQNLMALPGCNDQGVRQLASEITTDVLSEQGTNTTGLSLSNFAEVEDGEGDTRRLCSFTLSLGEEKTTMYLAVTWRNVETGEFEVTIAGSPAALSE